MSEIQAAGDSKTKRPETVYTEVVMADGTKVQFAGKRKIDKDFSIDVQANTAAVRLNIRNGRFVVVSTKDLGTELLLRAAAHGLHQKLGDAAAGLDDEDDIFEAIEEVRKQLVEEGTWNVAREAGDSMAGSAIVLRAVSEVTGKSLEHVKKTLQGRLDAAKARGEKLTRQALYASFRRPGTPTAAVIRRLEEEKAAKAGGTAPDAADLLAEIGA